MYVIVRQHGCRTAGAADASCEQEAFGPDYNRGNRRSGTLDEPTTMISCSPTQQSTKRTVCTRSPGEYTARHAPRCEWSKSSRSCELKLKPKNANISGLQLADLLGHPVKQWVLRRYEVISAELAPFAQQLMTVVEPKLNRHLYKRQIDGYGAALFRKK